MGLTRKVLMNIFLLLKILTPFTPACERHLPLVEEVTAYSYCLLAISASVFSQMETFQNATKSSQTISRFLQTIFITENSNWYFIMWNGLKYFVLPGLWDPWPHVESVQLLERNLSYKEPHGLILIKMTCLKGANYILFLFLWYCLSNDEQLSFVKFS